MYLRKYFNLCGVLLHAMTCLDAIIVILAHPTMLCIHLVARSTQLVEKLEHCSSDSHLCLLFNIRSCNTKFMFQSIVRIKEVHGYIIASTYIHKENILSMV